MTVDRGEMMGTAGAIALHVALIAALSLSLAHTINAPEPPSMEVELVDEVGLTAAAPTSIPQPAPAATAPEISEAEAAEPVPAPTPQPLPPPQRIVPTPAQRPAAKPVTRPTPPKAAPAKPAPAKPRASRIGDDFLKGIADGDERATAPAKPSAARFDARAKADIASAIAAQIRPCALQQRDLGPGANRIRVVLNLRLAPTGRLKDTPSVVRTSGVDDDNAQYEELVKDQAIASYRSCAPLRLPAELYSTPDGGWANINMTYRVP